MASYILSSVSRRTPAGGVIADMPFLKGQRLLLEAFPTPVHALYSAFNFRNAQMWTYQNGEVVGAAITSHPADHEGELHFFAVVPSLQRQGIGKAMYTALESAAFADRKKIIAVTHIPAFFEKLGFFDRSPPGRRDTERYMVKAL